MAQNIVQVSPFRCRMWSMHDRMSEDLSSPAARQLIESIRAHGQKHPALGRRIADGTQDSIELIYGARRLAATRDLGIDLLVEIRDIDDRSALIAMDIENRLREDISPYERGLSYRRWLHSNVFSTQSELAKAIAVSEAQVSRLLRYAELPAAIVAAFSCHRDIREDWAVMLAKICKDPAHRDGVYRRARHLSAMSIRPAAPEIFNHLICGSSRVSSRTRGKDDVVRGRSGDALFRVGVRNRAIHLIVPRARVSKDTLMTLVEDVRSRLDAVRMAKDGT
jgi:ParB family chromosome partitioning protein